MHYGSKSEANPSSNPSWDQVLDEISASLTWQRVQSDVLQLAELMHSTILFIMKADRTISSRFASEFQEQLMEMPEGWRLAEYLQEIDQKWGRPLEGFGISFEKIIAAHSRPQEIGHTDDAS